MEEDWLECSATRWCNFGVLVSIIYITCITKVTLKFINYPLTIRCLIPCTLLISLVLFTNQNRLKDNVGLQAQLFQLFTDWVRWILVFEGQDYSDHWVLFLGRCWLWVFNSRGNKQLDCRVDKVLWIFQSGENCCQTVIFFRKIRPVRW